MFRRFLKRTVAMPIVEAVILKAIEPCSYNFLADVRKFDAHYDNEDIYFILNDMEETWTQQEVDVSLQLCYEAGILTPKLLKKYVKMVYDGVKLANVKINDWNDISFTVKFTEPRFFYWEYKHYDTIINSKREDICSCEED